MRKGITNLPLHHGRAPSWLFKKMVNLSRQITIVICEEFGPNEVLQRMSDPYWFQAFGCVLGFDWHSSGLTTTVCGALKEGMKEASSYTGIYVAGGKGKASLNTPNDIRRNAELAVDPETLVQTSKMVAKVDNSAVQDGYQLYHHTMIYTQNGDWTVIQQGMNEANKYARRYHWLGENVDSFTLEPHSAICCDMKQAKVLDLVASNSQDAQKTIVGLAAGKPERTLKDIEKVAAYSLPSGHSVPMSQVSKKRLSSILEQTYERKAQDFETLLGMRGVGPATLRALALVSELVHGTKPSWQDPARYSFTHGGKDGFPYPVNEKTYNDTMEFLNNIINKSAIDRSDKAAAFQRLYKISK